jgi:hypothetical protein
MEGSSRSLICQQLPSETDKTYKKKHIHTHTITLAGLRTEILTRELLKRSSSASQPHDRVSRLNHSAVQ